MRIPYVEWMNKVEGCIFFEDLRATLDGMDVGEIDHSCVNKLCERNGYTFNWSDFSLEKHHADS